MTDSNPAAPAPRRKKHYTHDYFMFWMRAWKQHGEDGTPLTLEEKGALIDLIAEMHLCLGPIPNHGGVLARIFGSGNIKADAIVRRLIRLGKIETSDDGKFITQNRVMRELDKVGLLSGKNATNGSLGGKAKAKNRAAAGRVSAECEPSDPPVNPECGASAVEVRSKCGRSARPVRSRFLKKINGPF